MISILPFILWLYLQFVHRTSRLIWSGREQDKKLKNSGSPYLIAFWHNRQAYLLYPYRGRGVAILISPSRDGEIVARMANYFGQTSVRGSSRKGPAGALRALIKTVREGRTIAITPDGPLGPAREVKSGAVYLAQALELPILPLAASSSRKIVLKSWDSFLFPLPFSRIALVCGEPLKVGPGDDLEQKALELKKALDQATDKADELVQSI